MVYLAVFWLHVYPPSQYVATNRSPRELITEATIDYNNHCKLPYGTYDHMHEGHNNNMALHTVRDGFGTESLHDPPPKQDEDGSDDVSAAMQEEESQLGDDDAFSLPSIPSIQDAKICHDTDNFDTTDTTASTAIET
eukprot:219745-Ditylum_brightwellii.AAC.1